MSRYGTSPVSGVTELDPEDPKATVCGHCGRGWDDSISTDVTPVPAGRCPFEYQHSHSWGDIADGTLPELREFNEEMERLAEEEDEDGDEDTLDSLRAEIQELQAQVAETEARWSQMHDELEQAQQTIADLRRFNGNQFREIETARAIHPETFRRIRDGEL